jgi:hypothetical protein
LKQWDTHWKSEDRTRSATIAAHIFIADLVLFAMLPLGLIASFLLLLHLLC